MEAMTIDERIRHSNLNREYSPGIEVDDSMSDELLTAFFFYQEYLDQVPRNQVEPDDLNAGVWERFFRCSTNSTAPDQGKAR